MKIAIVYTPEKIDPEVVDWVTSRWNGCPDDIIPFLKHLAAIRQGADIEQIGSRCVIEFKLTRSRKITEQ